MKTRCRRAMRNLPRECRRTNGTPLRLATLRAPRAIPRASSPITAAPISTPSAISSPAISASIRSISGRCRCSTATAGVFRGPSPRRPASTSACARSTPRKIFELIPKHGVTHMCGAPIVYNTLINAPDAPKKSAARPVVGLIAGAAPPVAVLEGAENIGIKLTHVYGLTEVYGPASVCAEQPGWDELPADQRAQLKRRQGVSYPLQEGVTVIDPETMREVPRDGETIGEVMFRGNIVMKGYLKNEKATREAFAGGWFHTGDLGVLDEHGYVIIKDRSKDIIISGGENISSVEVEDVLYKHPAVLFAAVVAKPDAKWGEVPCAFIELKDNAQRDAKPRSSHFAAARCPASRRRRPWCSVRFQRHRPARSRNSCCAIRSIQQRRFRRRMRSSPSCTGFGLPLPTQSSHVAMLDSCASLVLAVASTLFAPSGYVTGPRPHRFGLQPRAHFGVAPRGTPLGARRRRPPSSRGRASIRRRSDRGFAPKLRQGENRGSKDHSPARPHRGFRTLASPRQESRTYDRWTAA